MKDDEPQGLQGRTRPEYLKKFQLTPGADRSRSSTRDYNRMLELGGNIYFTAKLGATDGHSFQHLAAVMTGSTQQGLCRHDARPAAARWKATAASPASDKPAIPTSRGQSQGSCASKAVRKSKSKSSAKRK